MPLEQKNAPFKLPLEFLQKVKYGGAVGKQTVITVVAMIVLAVAFGAVWGNVSAVYILVVALLVIFFGSLASIHKTLKDSPSLAMLEGSELVAYRKVELATKERGPLPETPPVLNSGQLALPAVEDDGRSQK
jgi:hypothetical protein